MPHKQRQPAPPLSVRSPDSRSRVGPFKPKGRGSRRRPLAVVMLNASNRRDMAGLKPPAGSSGETPRGDAVPGRAAEQSLMPRGRRGVEYGVAATSGEAAVAQVGWPNRGGTTCCQAIQLERRVSRPQTTEPHTRGGTWASAAQSRTCRRRMSRPPRRRLPPLSVNTARRQAIAVTRVGELNWPWLARSTRKTSRTAEKRLGRAHS